MELAPLLLLAALIVLTSVVYQRCKRSQYRPLPPGPKGVPIVGNIRDLPPNGQPEHEHWIKHKGLYGGISSITVKGMTLVILHHRKAAHELLVQRSSKTSGRPRMVMANEMCGYGSIVVCQDYTAKFRRCRKLLHQELGTVASAAQFEAVQEAEVRKQLVRGLHEPRRWLEHYKTTASANVLEMAYGYSVDSQGADPLVHLVEKMMLEFSLAAAPMAWAVDIIPALKHLPDGFPGATFQRTARRWRESINAAALIPYRFVRRRMAKQNNRPCYVSKLVESLKSEEDATLSKEDEDAIIWTAASLYGAAADTTVITLTALTLAMVKFPDAQRHAQEEIERVVGSDRLPTFSDRKDLPYVNALVKEAIRWWPVAPMGFPHHATESLEYAGYHIPQGAYILPAVWWFTHDPEVYTSPLSFDPSRFLPPRSEPDPGEVTFGFGRRICPGRFFADSGLYLNVVQSLATFEFLPAKDQHGEAVPVDVKPKPGILSYPMPFEFEIRPRSEKHVNLIRQIERDLPVEASDAHLLESMQDFRTN